MENIESKIEKNFICEKCHENKATIQCDICSCDLCSSCVHGTNGNIFCSDCEDYKEQWDDEIEEEEF